MDYIYVMYTYLGNKQDFIGIWNYKAIVMED